MRCVKMVNLVDICTVIIGCFIIFAKNWSVTSKN